MGITSLVLKIATQELAIFNFILLRFVTVFLLCVILFYKKTIAGFSRNMFMHSLLVGVVTFLAHVFCTTGVAMTPVSVAGFLTNLSTIFIPVIAFVFLRQRFSLTTVLCIVGAFVSICLITLGNKMEYNNGVWFCITRSLLAAVQILLLEKYTKMGDDVIALTVCQLGVKAICALIAALFISGIHLPRTAPGWICVGWTAVVSTALATYIQTMPSATPAPYIRGLFFPAYRFSAL